MPRSATDDEGGRPREYGCDDLVGDELVRDRGDARKEQEMARRLPIPYVDEGDGAVQHLDASGEIKGFVDIEIGMPESRGPAQKRKQEKSRQRDPAAIPAARLFRRREGRGRDGHLYRISACVVSRAV